MGEEPIQPGRPVFLYDGDCGFCRGWVERWRDRTAGKVEFLPLQEAAARFPHLSPDRLRKEGHLVEPDGTVRRGAHAVFSALAYAPRGRVWLRLYRYVPGFAPVSEWFYRRVANNRGFLSACTRWLWGTSVPRPSFHLTRWLFLRAVALVYVIAFLSLAVQIVGLVGERGILPAGRYLEWVHSRLGEAAYHRVPTLAWIDVGDRTLRILCWGGAAAAALAFFRIAPAQMFALAWIAYLSLYHVGQTFLRFQWDILLLETGFLAILFAPWRLRPRLESEPPPSRLVRFLIVLLLFRLMFSSGIVKLLDDDPVGQEWHHLTALNYHFETECIPNPVAWYAHKLPEPFLKFCVLAMFGIEIAVPFLFFLPRRPRIIACFLQILLQLLIILTGNYGFFNWLTIALCIVLLDDAFLRRFFPRRAEVRIRPDPSRPRMPLVQRAAIVPLALILFVLNGIWMADTLRADRRQHVFSRLPGGLQTLLTWTEPFQLVNPYGLFRHMTTRRPEIIIEGSNDGRTWKPYEFKYKPGRLDRRPPFVAPHQPRLDWQMWFAALGDYRQPRNRWFVSLARRLLDGSPDVLDLLETNPFPDTPPRYLRAVLYDYHYTTWAERKKTGHWWKRSRLRTYFPVVTRDSFRPRRPSAPRTSK